MKIVIVANIPAPYRESVYEQLSEKDGVDLTVIYCAAIEKNRKWIIENPRYKAVFLKSKTFSFGEYHFHFNTSEISKQLRSINPNIVITNAFAFPMLVAFLYTLFFGKKHICFTDGTLVTEKKLTILHKLVRKLVFSKTSAFIGPSDATEVLYKSYGVDGSEIFKSHLCVDNKKYINNVLVENREYDILFVGQFIERKCTDFFARVVSGLVMKLGVCNVRVVGSGPLQETFIQALKSTNANVTFDGFVQQDELPAVYRSAKLLLMPTKEDCWGVVANEALASGTPVITNIEAGVAGELVIDGISGRVLDLDVNTWVEEIIKLLSNKDLLQHMSVQSHPIVSDYTFTNASQGIYDAIKSV